MLVFGIIGTVLTIFSFAASPNTSVDFTNTTTTLANKPFSSTISTYGENNTNILASTAQRTVLGNLKAGYYRVPLQWNGGNIASSAGGHPSGSGDAWVSNIKAMGAEPQIVVGGSQDNNFTADDAANMVRHFNKPTSGQANRVNVWVIGNEPNNGGMSIQTYCTLFNAAAAKMKAVDPTIKVAGPAWSYFDINTLNTFLQCAGNSVDIIDYHHYAMGGSYLSDATALAQTIDWENEVKQVKQSVAQYVPARASQIEVQVGEYNWAWQTADGYNGWQGDDRFYQGINTVWGASVAGHIAKAGGRGHQYSDLNGALGLTFEKTDAASHYGRNLNDPLPIYYGLEMFTGGNLFRSFGNSMVSASTSLSNVEVYASNNSKNIVLINKSPTATQPAVLSLTGFGGGTADVWQTNAAAPFSAPVHKATLQNVTTSLSYDLPPYSVTTFVLTDGQVSTPTPTPTPSPSNSSGQLKGIASKCLDNKSNLKLDGNKIQLWGCNGTLAQKWTAQSNGAITNNSNGYCLDAQNGSTAQGTIVQLFHCNGTLAQQWRVNATTGVITNQKSGLCLDDKSANTADGTQIQLWGCNGTPAQKWLFSN